MAEPIDYAHPNLQPSQLLRLPQELLHHLMGFLSFDEIGKSRQVCRLFDVVCSNQLNRGFQVAERLVNQMQREVRNKLPRRESERRNHSLARHADILSAIETRLSLLQITYSKYIESGYCCFIPGKVLDEMFRVLRYVRVEQNPRRSHEVLQELRDISSMAMEHFDETILPGVKLRMQAHGVTVLPGGFTVSIDERPVVVHAGSHSPAVLHNSATEAVSADLLCSRGDRAAIGIGTTSSPGLASAALTPKPLLVALQSPQSPAACGCSGAIGRLQANSGAHAACLNSLRLDVGSVRNKLLDLERVCLRRERRANRLEQLVSEQARQISQQNVLVAGLSARVAQLERSGCDSLSAATGNDGIDAAAAATRAPSKRSSSAASVAGDADAFGSSVDDDDDRDDDGEQPRRKRLRPIAADGCAAGVCGSGLPAPSAVATLSVRSSTGAAARLSTSARTENRPGVVVGSASSRRPEKVLRGVGTPRRLFVKLLSVRTRARFPKPAAVSDRAAAAAWAAPAVSAPAAAAAASPVEESVPQDESKQ